MKLSQSRYSRGDQQSVANLYTEMFQSARDSKQIIDEKVDEIINEEYFADVEDEALRRDGDLDYKPEIEVEPTQEPNQYENIARELFDILQKKMNPMTNNQKTHEAAIAALARAETLLDPENKGYFGKLNSSIEQEL